ncbi:MAG TPA: SBBP repeat-containing protein [Pyrinomonadaceae bacterium]
MKSCPANAKLSLSLALVLSCLLNLSLPPAGRTVMPRTAADSRTQAATPTLDPAPAPPPTQEEATREAYGKLELQFEANQGQTDASVDFLARGAGYTMFLTPTEAVFVMARHEGERQARGEEATGEQAAQKANSTQAAPTTNAAAVRSERDVAQTALRMKLVGARASAAAEGAQELEGKVNYFTGNDPAKWRANVPTFGRVRYREIYPGIDVVYYGNQRQLEYDFVVAPGSDASAVSLKFDGADKVEVDEGGDLLLTLGSEVVRQHKPVVYQEAASGARREVEGGYELRPDGRVGFRIGMYDTQRPLVIDPVLVYSTYLGGSSTDLARAIAVDPSGNAVITGYTTSLNFPTANAFQSAFNGTSASFGNRDVFVTKINAAGNAYVYSTYLGGNFSEEARGIAVDSSGNAYVAGFTDSTNFPIANAVQATMGGTQDAFVTKLNAAGSALVYSTYLGGAGFSDGANSSEFGEAIAVDSSGNAYVTGNTFSDNFPVVNPVQATFAGGSTDAFVTKINAAGDAFVYSTYLGGSGMNGSTQPETGFGIAADSAGNAYITGETNSNTDFPRANAIQNTFGGGISDAFVTKINADGSAFVYSTYLGGGAQDAGEDIEADASGNTYVAGFTVSDNFPVANAFQGTFGGVQDAFVTKLNPTGSTFIYSTYLGGTGGEIAFGIAVDASNSVYLGGTTGTLNTFPVRNANQCTRNTGTDLFITKFNPAATELIYSTYIGGSGDDRGEGIALDPSNNAYMAGSTTSTDFPTVNPIQSMNNGGSPFGDAYVIKFNDALPPNACATPTPSPTVTPTPAVVQFAQATYTVAEGLERNTDPASLTVTVSRTVNTTGSTTVEYRTVDRTDAVRCDTANGMAYHRCDYATTLGTLTFAPTETTKTFSVFITDDAHVEGNETFQITLANATGGGIGTQATTTVTIQDNDAQANVANPIDTSEFFIRQHYIDFLMRAPEAMGFAQWVAVLNNCGAESGDRGRNPSCDRVAVSSGFFRSDEYLQVKGYFAYRFYEVAFDRRPTYVEFARDLQRLTGTTAEDTLARMTAFTDEFTQRPEFVNAYPADQTLSAYVDALFTKAEIGDRQSITRQDNTTLTRAQLADGSRTRASILREIVESREVAAIFFNRAFVAAQYFGYLRRDPESPGYEMWLAYLNANPNDFRTMVSGFVNSVEYRLRFGRPN